jgi:hypothetical protein
MEKLRKIRLLRVQYVPRALEHGLLYVSEEFGAAVHLCACGCGAKVSTPLGPTEWSLKETPAGPSLRPSVGNWQLPCQSHYWISSGNVIWHGAWSQEEIVAGREREERNRHDYYEALDRRRSGLRSRFWRWIQALFGR